MPPALLKIRLYGDPSLRKKSQPLSEISSGERMLIQAMLATMYDTKGVGLAAAQVGIPQRLFVTDAGEGPQVFINPKILKKSGSEILEEGCLSIPNVTVSIKRAKTVLVQYLDEDKNKHERIFENLMARIIQHEIDHLDGKLIVDYATREVLKKHKEQLDNLQARARS